MARLVRRRLPWVCLLLLCPVLASLGACAQREAPQAGQEAAPPENTGVGAGDGQQVQSIHVPFVRAGGEDLPDMSGVPTDELVALLEKDDYRAAMAAAAELAKRDPEDIEPHLPTLIDLALAPEPLDLRLNPQMRYSGIIWAYPCTESVADAIGRAGESAAPMLEERLRPAPGEYSREDSEAQRRIVLLLAHIGKPAVPALLKALTLGHPAAEHEALRALTELGPDAEAALPTLIELLMARSGHARNLTSVIGAIGPAAVEPLRARLRDAAETGNDVYLSAAAKLGPGGASILAQALECGEVGFRADAASLLRRVRPEDGQCAVPGLLRALSGEPAVATNAMRALAHIGDPRAIEPLSEFLRTGDPNSHYFALCALLDLGADDRALPVLDAWFRDRPANLHGQGLGVLHEHPECLERYLDAVIADLAADPGSVRAAAAWALAGRPELAERAMPRLIEMLGDPEEQARVGAASALGAIGPRAADAVPRLRAMLGRGSESSFACSALARIGTPALPTLLELARDGHGEVRVQAIRALADSEADATEALPLLDALRQDTTVSADLREAATGAYYSVRNRAERARRERESAAQR